MMQIAFHRCQETLPCRVFVTPLQKAVIKMPIATFLTYSPVMQHAVRWADQLVVVKRTHHRDFEIAQGFKNRWSQLVMVVVQVSNVGLEFLNKRFHILARFDRIKST
jgi:hypothetical protein